MLNADRTIRVSVLPIPAKHLDSATVEELKLLGNTYKNWTFNNAAQASTGTFNILQYDPFAGNTLGGAEFSVLYDDGIAQPRTDYDWIQIAYPHNWGQFDSKTNIDSTFNNFPFYSNYTPISLPTLMSPSSFFGPAIWLTSKDYPQQKIQNPAGGSKVPAGDLLFVDEPTCPYSALKPNDYCADDFHLYLATFTWNQKGGAAAGGTVTLYDGINWGVRMDAAVPEPAALVLALVGALIAAAFRRAVSYDILVFLREFSPHKVSSTTAPSEFA